jgi:hypothetical protein
MRGNMAIESYSTVITTRFSCGHTETRGGTVADPMGLLAANRNTVLSEDKCSECKGEQHEIPLLGTVS